MLLWSPALCKAVLVKSFARIHETNLKTRIVRIDICNEADYDKIQENDTINFTDLVDFARETINIRIRS
jgi:aconitate hydratase